MPDRKVLFVTHDAYRAGATIFLLNMLRWIAQHTDLRFEVAMPNQGEMVAAFAELCPVHIVAAPGTPPSRRRRWRDLLPGRGPAAKPLPTLQGLLDSGRFDLLYLNTITLGHRLAGLDTSRVAVVTHVHELEHAIHRYAHGQERRVIERSDALVCVSDAVARNLEASLGAPREKLRRIHGFVPVPAQPPAPVDRQDHPLLAPLGVPADALIVGLCGHGDIRKGADLLVPLARCLPAALGGRALHLVWVGAQPPEYPADLAARDRRCAGVEGRVHFVGVSRTPADWIALFDLHLLLAREDPFPLVVMEAAAQGVPTVCFGGAGGAEEFVRDDAGRVVPYLDLPALARCLLELLADDAGRRALGAVARQRVVEGHAPEVIVPQLVSVIESQRRRP